MKGGDREGEHEGLRRSNVKRKQKQHRDRPGQHTQTHTHTHTRTHAHSQTPGEGRRVTRRDTRRDRREGTGEGGGEWEWGREKVCSQRQQPWQRDSSGGQAATALAESRPSWSPRGGGGTCLFVLLFGLFVSFVPSTDFASFPDPGLMEELYGFFLKRQD